MKRAKGEPLFLIAGGFKCLCSWGVTQNVNTPKTRILPAARPPVCHLSARIFKRDWDGFFRHMEFDSLLNMITMNNIPRITPEVVSNFQVFLCLLLFCRIGRVRYYLTYTAVTFCTFQNLGEIGQMFVRHHIDAGITVNTSSTKMPPVCSRGDAHLV